MTVVGIILLLVAAYFAVGVPFAIVFVARGAAAIDAVARHAGWGFRLLILPGSAALWPLLLQKWIAAARTPGRRT